MDKMFENIKADKRFRKTIRFLNKHIDTSDTILDLGNPNNFSELMKKNGYKVKNTSGTDLDFDISEIESSNAHVVTALEIIEHLLSPLPLLCSIKAKKLIASVPLKLWFANAYRNNEDERDRHYHEFEEWQFNWLLEKSGWKIIDSEKWTNPSKKLGFRPILRFFVPRYYIVYAERINSEEDNVVS